MYKSLVQFVSLLLDVAILLNTCARSTISSPCAAKLLICFPCAAELVTGGQWNAP